MVTRVIVLLLISVVAASGQALNSGSNGSDGALTLATAGEMIFDPVALGIDVDRDNVFHFTTITIGPGVVVKMPFSALQGAPVVWLATGAVQIDGTIDLNGEAGAPATGVLLDRTTVPGPGGYPGGAGGSELATASGVGPLQQGLGPGGSGVVFFGGGNWRGGGAGHALPAQGSVYGNAVLVPLRGGSGGGGGGLQGGVIGGGGGAGGGALRIFSSHSIIVDGAVMADGGSGGGSADGLNTGGGGSGGGIHLIAPVISGSGTLQARGGASGSDDSFGSGSVGRVRLDALTQQFSGTANPVASQGTPYNVPLPPPFPSVRVTSIAGIPVSATPTGEAATPDVSLDEDGPVTVTIEAHHIPLGTVVQVRIMSEAVPDFVVNSTPLSGTLEESTATAEVVFPPGFSRGFVRAMWSPQSP